MDPTIKYRIRRQGYSRSDMTRFLRIDTLSRWTPLACATLGATGMILESPTFLITAGLLTSIGVFGRRSFYDYIYEHGLRYVFDFGHMPPHGNPRRFGCGMGATMLVLSGIGFAIGNLWLAFVPGTLIVALALIAAVTQWCFASEIYHWLFKTDEKCCD